jgi:predicted RNA polymerase sigma factor
MDRATEGLRPLPGLHDAVRGRLRRCALRRARFLRLEIVDALDLDDYQYLHSTRGELLRRLGRPVEARAGYERALKLARSEPERRFLAGRIAEL